MVDQRERWKQWSEEKAALGLCARCGKNPVKPGRASCRSCILKWQRRRKRLYNDRLHAGLCPHCGGKREDPFTIGCRSCNGKNAQRRVKFYNRDKKALYQRRLLQRRRREGVCTICGQGIDNPAFKLCSKCREERRLYYHENREHKLEYAKRRYHLTHRPKPLCPTCGRHHYRCSCGKMMKVNHGPDSCLFACKCGNTVVISRESSLVIQKPIL